MACRSIEEAIEELFYWQYGSCPTNFTAKLYDLMQKSDPDNKHRLRTAFPVEAQALDMWMRSANPTDLFHSFGIGLKKGDAT